MFILGFLKCAFFSLVTLIVCVFLCAWCFDQTVKTNDEFIEAFYWFLGTLFGISPVYLIPLICYYLLH